MSTVELSIELYCREESIGNCSTCSPDCTCNYCPCPLGYTGDDCSINIDDCEGETCNNRGTCQDLIGSFRCQCDSGFEGDRCEIRSGLLNYQLTVQIFSVNNTNHSLADSSCRDCCDELSLFCDLSVQYCIRPINSSNSNSSSSNIEAACSNYLKYTSQVYMDAGVVNFVATNDPIQRHVITNLLDVRNELINSN